MRYHLTTLGCPKNVTDSHSLERTLASAGHAPAGSDAADVLIVNTCGFIDAAKEESRAVTAQLADAKRPGQQLFVIGCWSQLDGDRIRAALPAVDAVFGIEAWDRIAAALGPASPPDIPDAAAAPTRTSAYLKISDGCARPCTFCNIPGIKGDRFRTTPLETLLEQARAHADAGAKELVLVAQDSTAYGEEQGERDGLPALLRALAAAVPDLPWLRLMYAYPGRVSHALVETMADLPQCCHYLDIPLQHGSPTVLRRMKRPHNVPMVLDTLGRLRAAMPDIAIRTTFIVGFPGETEAEFDELLSFVRTTRFDRAGAFVYSPQKGTPAALMPDQIPEPLKAERLERLMALQAQISAEINASLVGRELPILVESVEGSTGPDGEPIFVGRSYRDAPEIDGLVFANGLARPGTMPRVRITAAMEHDLFATPIGADAALPLLQL